jgi:hypothetical protein
MITILPSRAMGASIAPSNTYSAVCGASIGVQVPSCTWLFGCCLQLCLRWPIKLQALPGSAVRACALVTQAVTLRGLPVLSIAVGDGFAVVATRPTNAPMLPDTADEKAAASVSAPGSGA